MDEKYSSIETPRLILREIEEDDAKEIVRWRSNPDYYQYFISPHPISIEEHLNWFYKIYSLNSNRIEWVAIEKKSSEKIGVFGISRLEQNCNEARLNYLLDLKYQHMGLAKEAVCGVIKWACNKWNIKKFTAEIHKNNNNSIHFIERMDFVYSELDGDFLLFKKIVDTRMGNMDDIT